MSQLIHRRHFLAASLAAVAATALRHIPSLVAAEPTSAPKLKKAVKFDMIKIDGSIEEKFNLIKSLGFLGVEMNSPADIDQAEVLRAKVRTGIEIHGVVDSMHWKYRLSDPDPAVRAKGLEALKTALHDAHTYGATTVLLVPGKMDAKEDQSFEQTWDRSHEEIRKVLPLAEELNVKIAIEAIWNNFITTHEQFVKYVDSFDSKYLGAYFDMSNMVKYGVADAEWVRALGPRMLKFDFKGYSRKKGWVPIGEGDEDWPEVRKALDEINYHGWATAEVAGGGEKELRDVSQRMDKILGLG